MSKIELKVMVEERQKAWIKKRSRANDISLAMVVRQIIEEKMREKVK